MSQTKTKTADGFLLLLLCGYKGQQSGGICGMKLVFMLVNVAKLHSRYKEW